MWSHDEHQAAGREGSIAVPGAQLRYRLAGAGAQTVVIENAWRVSHPYAVWLEQALAPDFRVLSYDRAGTGDSAATAAQTAAGFTQQLQSLLTALNISTPVIIAGHSYGGLVGALHAAQAPGMVRALLQIDPTPDAAHELLEAPLRSLPLGALYLKARLRLGLGDPSFDSAAAELPPQIMTAIRQADEPQRIRRSLDGAIAEIKLRGNIRAAIAAAGSAGQCPRLIIASSMREKPETWLAKRLVNPHKLELTYQAIEQLLQRQATLHRASRLIALPYSHASLVTNRESAARIAAQLQEFLP